MRVVAPIPGKNTVGIEVPNSEISLVSLRGVMESKEFRRLGSRLKIALGQGVAGQPVVADLATMPHLLIAGATGSGKSVCINAITTCLASQSGGDQPRASGHPIRRRAGIHREHRARWQYQAQEDSDKQDHLTGKDQERAKTSRL